MKLSSSKTSSVIILTLLVAVLLFAVYYYVVLPKKDEVKSLESSVSTIKSEVASLQSEMKELEKSQSKGASNLYSLRKKIPENRDIDKLILNIEEIEYVTGSRITGIEFNNYDQTVEDSTIKPKEEDSGNSNDTNATTENNSNTNNNTTSETGDTTSSNTEGNNIEQSETENQPVSPVTDLQLPSDLKLITFNIKIMAPSDKKVREFIGEIEKLERIMHVDTIEYDVPGEEQEFEENPKKYVEATIQVTTFFYTGD